MPIYEPKDQTQIAEHFKQYVSVMYPGLTPDKLPKIQREQIEQTFYAGWGQCLLFLKNGMGNLQPLEITEVLDGMEEQIRVFFKNQIK